MSPSKRAPRRWTSVELLLADGPEGWTTRYRSEPGRTEPLPTGHKATEPGRWRDGLPEGMEAVSSHATLGVAMKPAREKFPHKPRSERFEAPKAVLNAPIGNARGRGIPPDASEPSRKDACS
jgi:hypothetical protein